MSLLPQSPPARLEAQWGGEVWLRPPESSGPERGGTGVTLGRGSPDAGRGRPKAWLKGGRGRRGWGPACPSPAPASESPDGRLPPLSGARKDLSRRSRGSGGCPLPHAAPTPNTAWPTEPPPAVHTHTHAHTRHHTHAHTWSHAHTHAVTRAHTRAHAWSHTRTRSVSGALSWAEGRRGGAPRSTELM